MKQKLIYLYDRLLSFYGPQKWWPADSEWEVVVGAILTQNTNWKNVEKAITNLKNSKLLLGEGGFINSSTSPIPNLKNSINRTYPEKLLLSATDDIAELIRPSGYYNMKAHRLKNMAEWWLDCISKKPHGYALNEINDLRDSLLQVNGVGPETADTIILYAFQLPVFVIDTYTKRIASMYINTSEKISYDDLQMIFMQNLPHETELFNEFHALIVSLGKEREWKRILQNELC